MKLEKLAEYAKSGNLGKVKQVLNSELVTKIHLNAQSSGGATPLIYACHYGYDEIVDVLLADIRVEVNRPLPSGASPLLFAVQKGSLSSVKSLLMAGADMDVGPFKKDGSMLLPIDLARFKGFERVLTTLEIFKKRNTPAVSAATESIAESVDETAAIEMSPEISAIVERFGEKTGYSFKNPDFLLCALTRPSAISSGVRLAGRADFEKYEFAGDGLLGFAVRSLLNKFHPEYTLGQLNDEYQRLTRNADAGHAHGGPMYRIAKDIGLRDFIIKDESEDLERAGHRGKTKHGSKRKTLECILADHMEALLYAIYLDSCSEAAPKGDFEVVFDFVERFWGCLGLNEAVKSVSDYGRSLFSKASTGSEIPNSSDGAYSDPYGGAGAGAGDPDTHLLLAASRGRAEYLRCELEKGGLTWAQLEKITKTAVENGKSNVVTALLNPKFLNYYSFEKVSLLISNLLTVKRPPDESFVGGYWHSKRYLSKLIGKIGKPNALKSKRLKQKASSAHLLFSPVLSDPVKLLLDDAEKGREQNLLERLFAVGYTLTEENLIYKVLLSAANGGKHNFVAKCVRLVEQSVMLSSRELHETISEVCSQLVDSPNSGALSPSQKSVKRYLMGKLSKLEHTEEAESSREYLSPEEDYDEYECGY